MATKSGSAKMVFLRNQVDSAYRHLPTICQSLFNDFLLSEHFPHHGVDMIYTGSMTRTIESDIMRYKADNWARYKSDFPEFAKKIDFDPKIFPPMPDIYPFLTILEDSGLIKYDRATHVMMIPSYFERIKWQKNFGATHLCNTLNAVMEKVSGHKFFDQYLVAHLEQFCAVLDKNNERYEKKIETQKILDEEVLTKEEKDHFEKIADSVRTAQDVSKHERLFEKINSFRMPKKSPSACKTRKMQGELELEGIRS